MSNKLILLLFVSLCCCYGCRDYSQVRLLGESVEEIMANVENNQNILDKINADYLGKHQDMVFLDRYYAVNNLLVRYWASPETMSRWYKIWLTSLQKSKEKFNTHNYYNNVACHALPWLIRTHDRETIAKLPVLEFPLFEEAKNKYLQLSPQKFADWIEKNIPDHGLENFNLPPDDYYGLIESAGLITSNYELAKRANRYLYNYLGLRSDAVSNLALYVVKSGKMTEEDKLILKDFYTRYSKELFQKNLTQDYYKRERYIMEIIKKYKLVPQA